MAVWHFEHSGAAYDASQCRDEIRRGDALVCADGVVGLAWAWPLAITVELGKLHDAKPGAWAEIFADAKISREQVRAAVEIARELGRPVNAEVETFARAA